MRFRLVIFFGVTAFVLPAPLTAATVSVDPPDGQVAVFSANPGETNVLTTTLFQTVTDSGAPLVAGDGCESLGPNSAHCPVPHFDAFLRDGNDTGLVVVNGIGRVFAGPGNDEVGADSFGGSTLLYGEAGNDRLDAFGEAGQIADGGPGNDDLRTGSFFGAASAFGGAGNDTIFHFTLFGGAATLDGGNGDDTISAHPAGAPGIATGGSGNDTIVVRVLAPSTSPPGSWSLFGDAGNDTLTGGEFADTVDGGSGNDTIDVQGGGADIVSCGSGNDVVRYDPSDTVASDCEVLIS
jgi:Ca2+-binding RTX toxin-like protein